MSNGSKLFNEYQSINGIVRSFGLDSILSTLTGMDVLDRI